MVSQSKMKGFGGGMGAVHFGDCVGLQAMEEAGGGRRMSMGAIQNENPPSGSGGKSNDFIIQNLKTIVITY